MSVEQIRRGPRRAELREFLRSRRARLTPADVGLAAGGRRRTPGLRREEVAMLAGIGISWYTWLEQGRDISASVDVLDAISATLRLSPAERAHLHRLAGAVPPSDVHLDAGPVPPELGRLIDAWSPRPAMLQDRHWNLLAINDGTREAFGYTDSDRNCLVSFFTNTRYREMYVEWAAAAPGVVAAFRADAGRYLDDPEFARIASELRTHSAEFAELWDRNDVGPHLQAVKAVRHPEAGELVFDKTTLAVTDHPDWHLVLYNPRPDTSTESRLIGLLTG
ncbi:helix-turn-helix transcriptional regulator [Mycobacterium deserti]|uniref:Helix-turn-helix transcriptional regulator n=1 Tax=Mycobacterium deserti TaxID=2978347 RepID=A0ABT2M9P6_9MYCO|nr:helix-turn-helix transcriptional regulator [Mycobacterium deserti]MCT7658661.1 helix-turn-helix transcriptional regulator [Mycobacterium deserti]